MFRRGDIIGDYKKALYDETIELYRVVSSRKISYIQGEQKEYVSFVKIDKEGKEIIPDWNFGASYVYDNQDAEEYQLIEPVFRGHPYTKIFH